MFVISLSRLALDPHDVNASRMWIETLDWLEPIQKELIEACNEAANSGGCPAPALVLEDGARCQLTCAPAKLMDCIPADTLQCRVKESGIVRLHGNGQLRPFEQVMLTAAIEKLVVKVFNSALVAADGPPSQSQAGGTDADDARAADWTSSPIWKDAFALNLLRQTLRAIQTDLPVSLGEKTLVDPCDDVLTFLCTLMESKLSILDTLSPNGDCVMKDDGDEDSGLRTLTAVVRLLNVNVKSATNPMECSPPRELSLKTDVGDITKLSVSTGSDGLSRLIDDSPSTYWESSGSVGQHVIEVALSESLVLSSVGIRLNRQDGSYCPRKIEISLLKSGESKWKVHSEKAIEPRGNQICMLAEDLDPCEEFQAVRIRILKNFDNGNDSRVHGLKITGQLKCVNRGLRICEDVALSVLSYSRKALDQIDLAVSRCNQDSKDREFKLETMLLHLEANAKALVAAASVLSLNSCENKTVYLIRLTDEASESAKANTGAKGASLGAEIALNAAFESIATPLAGLQLVNLADAASSTPWAAESFQLLDKLFQYGCYEVELFLSEKGKDRNPSCTGSFEWLRAGRTPCVNIISQIQAGIISSDLPNKDDLRTSGFSIESYLILYCAHARKILHILQEYLKGAKSGKAHATGRRWPKRLEAALSRSFLSSSLGPLMVGLSRLDWIRMSERTTEALIGMVSDLMPLSEADTGCRAVLNGILDTSSAKMKCPAGHDLQRKTLRNKNTCSCCEQETDPDMKAQACTECNYSICRGCTYLTGCYCAKRSPESSCRPSVWIALAISAFYNCAAIKLFEVDSEEKKSESPSTSLVARYRLLFAGGLQPGSAANNAVPESTQDDEKWLLKIRTCDGFSLSSDAMSAVNAMDSIQVTAVHKIFLALLHHLKLDVTVLHQEDPLPKIFLECYVKSINIVTDQVKDCRITNKNISKAVDELASRANFLLRDVCVPCGFQTNELVDAMDTIPESPKALPRDASEPPPSLTRQRSNPNAAPAPLFPAPLIRSESQNSVMRRSVSTSGADRETAASSSQSHSDNWEVGDRREVAESVVRFICDRSLVVAELRSVLNRIRSLCERHCRALHLTNELTRILTALAPRSTLRTNFIRMVLVNLQGCRVWMEAGAIKCSARDEFKELLQDFMKTHVLSALVSEQEDDKLCGIAALSAAMREEDVLMLVSSGIWDGVLSLCMVGKDLSSKENTGGFAHKPIKLPVETKVSVHSASANLDSSRNVLDAENTATYWQSDVGSNPERWITFEITPPQILQQVILHCADDQDRGSGYAPRDITIEAGPSPDSLERIVAASIPHNTNGPFSLIPPGNIAPSEPCSFVKFKIVECGGRNCRVRGMSFGLKSVDEPSANLPAVTVLSRAAATALVLTSFSRSEISKICMPTAPDVSGSKLKVVSSLINVLQLGSRYDSSTHSFAMGLVALCLPGAESQHSEATFLELTAALIRALLCLFAQETTDARIIAQALGLLKSAMQGCPPEVCDRAAKEAQGIAQSHSMEHGDQPESIPGFKFLEVASEFLHRHIDFPTKFLVARQSLAELMMELSNRAPWKIALGKFSRQQLDVLNQVASVGSLGTAGMTRAQYALSLLGGYIPILQIGCNAQLETGEHVRVLHYEFGDSRAGVVLVDGSINFVSSASLAMSPLSVSYLSMDDLPALLPLFKFFFNRELIELTDGKPKNFQVMDVYTRLLRCVVEHALQRPFETGQFLDSNDLLPHLFEISLKAKPKGSLIMALNALEEQMAVLESRVKFDALFAEAQSLGGDATGEVVGEDALAFPSPESKLSREGARPQRSPKYHVSRESIWTAVRDREEKSPMSTKHVRLLIERVHHDISLLYGLKSALILLPALPQCKCFLNSVSSDHAVSPFGSLGDICRQLLEKGIMCQHPMEKIEEAIVAFTAQGGEGSSANNACGPQLLQCIQSRLRTENVVTARKANIARSIVEAFPVGSRNSEWTTSVEFLGGAEFSVSCDPSVKLQGTLVLQSQKGGLQGQKSGSSAAEALVTFKHDDDKAKLAGKVPGKGAVLLAKFSPSSTEASKVGMRLIAESDVAAVAVESEHKYRDNVSYRGSVVFEGALELSVEFDKRCNTESGCDKLTFFADEQYKTDPFSSAHEFSGSGEINWKNFTVKSDRIFYSFSSDSSRNEWGYRFVVRNSGSFPVSDETNAQLTVASRSITAALQQKSLLRSLQTREWCQVLANICIEVTGAHRRSFLSCLSRLVSAACDFPSGELPDDACFGRIVRLFVTDYEAHLQSGEPVGAPDLLAHAFFVYAW
jgi:hypothetical protein